MLEKDFLEVDYVKSAQTIPDPKVMVSNVELINVAIHKRQWLMELVQTVFITQEDKEMAPNVMLTFVMIGKFS